MNKSIENLLYHSLNNSRSKICHAFNRTERFPKTIQSPCKRASYDLNLSSSLLGSTGKKSNRFGLEKKFQRMEMEIRRHSLSPSPGSYQFRDGFKLNSSKNNPSTFGKQKKMVLKTTGVPGPGKYEVNKYNPEATLSYTMRDRTAKNGGHWNVAGPGQYNLKSSFSTMNSRMEGSKAYMGKQKRFRVSNYNYPAPNAYQTQMQRMKTEPTSKYSDSQKYSFGNQKKGMNIRLDYPGPGTYQHFSEFLQSPYTSRT